MSDNLAVKAHRKLIMSRRVKNISKNIANLIPDEAITLLDVGAGSGEMAAEILKIRNDLVATGVDVYVRTNTSIPVLQYDGLTLPFEDRSFDVVTIVDVLHHCDNPLLVLRECARVSKGFVIIKDHISNSKIDEVLLRFMDWVGNRAHGVVLSYNYFSSKKWADTFAAADLNIIKSIYDLDIYPFPFDYFFGGSLHNLLLLKKSLVQ